MVWVIDRFGGGTIQIKLGIQVCVGFYVYKWKSGFRFCVYVKLKHYTVSQRQLLYCKES